MNKDNFVSLSLGIIAACGAVIGMLILFCGAIYSFSIERDAYNQCIEQHSKVHCLRAIRKDKNIGIKDGELDE